MFDLTLDNPTKSWLTSYYRSGKKVVLEFGTGGSTILALESNPDSVVYGCETDFEWLARLMLHASEKKLQGRLFPVYLNIGPTGKWGAPMFDDTIFTGRRMMSLLNTAITPWNTMDAHGVNPDFVFIDGRWRKACFLSSLLFCKSSMMILWDDYADRPQYHIFDEIIKPVEMIGRSALYEISPKSYDAAEIIKKFLHVYGDWG
tara:strand:+ start:83 stop:691 length:609 start_codon:yes stop_codon:yes gene_type:complete